MKNLLITGGTGTLGHALTRRLYDECDITIYSRSELNQAHMRAKYPRCRFVLGDVRDYERLKAAVAGHDTVIHAAAMKRIPECEVQPGLCFEINVTGSEFVAMACLLNGVETCIGISTDKACQAVTAYGASKLMMEKIFQSQPNDCRFVMVRYGNVLESNGSVIPLWRQQAAEGIPLTITNLEMTRFWMTPAIAAVGIKTAFETLEHAKILVPKLGALSIVQMAKYIAPNSDRVEVGMRSTERLHEYLVSADEFSVYSGAYFVITKIAEGSNQGHVYRSDEAPKLTRNEFMTMLQEVEAE